jgi:hypothetical protein
MNNITISKLSNEYSMTISTQNVLLSHNINNFFILSFGIIFFGMVTVQVGTKMQLKISRSEYLRQFGSIEISMLAFIRDILSIIYITKTMTGVILVAQFK